MTLTTIVISEQKEFTKNLLDRLDTLSKETIVLPEMPLVGLRQVMCPGNAQDGSTVKWWVGLKREGS